MSAPIRILLADDELLIRTALAQILDLEDDLSVVGEAPNGEIAVPLAVVLCLLSLPPLWADRARLPLLLGRRAAPRA